MDMFFDYHGLSRLAPTPEGFIVVPAQGTGHMKWLTAQVPEGLASLGELAEVYLKYLAENPHVVIDNFWLPGVMLRAEGVFEEGKLYGSDFAVGPHLYSRELELLIRDRSPARTGGSSIYDMPPGYEGSGKLFPDIKREPWFK